MEIKLKTKKGKKKAHPRLPNGFGSIVTLSGNRRKPYMARPPVKQWDDNGYPVYEKPIGYFSDWMEAFNALAEYNKNPYDTKSRYMTFDEIFKLWYKYKFNKDYTEERVKRSSSEGCYIGAYKKCKTVHRMIFADIKTMHMQDILNDASLSHAYMEHIVNLLKQMYKYSLEYDIVQKDYSAFIKITKEDDDQPGVPFTKDDIEKLWNNKDKPYVDTILIFIYTGWRISELLKMPLEKIDLEEKTMQGGVKTRASKNRIVPIHSKIYSFVSARKYQGGKSLICLDGKTTAINPTRYTKIFKETLNDIGIDPSHTPHDCRHTFASLLDNAGANKVSIQKLMGHSGKDITERTYTHKDIEELRKAIEMI